MEKLILENKKRKEIISTLDNEKDLIKFYEKQKVTFGSKKLSPKWTEYFRKFINSFLAIPILSRRSQEIVGYLLRHLEEINPDEYNNIINTIKKHKNYHQIMKEKHRSKNRINFFNHIQTFPELKEEFEKYYTMFHHLPKDKEIIKKFYIHFIEKFITFLDSISKKEIDFSLKAILLLELQAYKIDHNFTEYYKIEEKIPSKLLSRLWELSITSKVIIKKWNIFFKYKNKDELLKYYNKIKTTFYRKNSLFFKEFIKALAQYKWTYEIDSKINTLIQHLKNKNQNYDIFLKKLNIEESKLITKKTSISPRKKKNKPKKIQTKQTSNSSLSISKSPISKNKKTIKETKESTINNTIKKTQTNLIQLINLSKIRSKYKSQIKQIEKYCKNNKLSEKEIQLLINNLKLNDLINIIKITQIKLSNKQKKEIYQKCLSLTHLLTLSEENLWILKYLIENYSENKEKDIEFFEKHLQIKFDNLKKKKI